MIQEIEQAVPLPQASITAFIALLLIASAVAMATKWVRVPYTLALVIVGLIISPMHFLPSVHISPDLILLIFLPALLFEAAWNLKLDRLRENLLPILALATVGVGLSAGVIGLILHFGIGLSWSSALLFGSIISATDPVSVLAIFKTLGAPARLTAIIEAESLANDGTAVVIFRIVLGIATGVSATHSATGILSGSVREFIVVVFGGIVIGAIAGTIASKLTSYFDDHLLEITLTTITAYGAFLIAEGLHVSPVIAVLVAGLILGNYGRESGMSPTTQVAVNSFWEYAAFVVNSLVFLLIGLEIQLSAIREHLWAVGWAILAMLAARAVTVYGLVPVVNLRTKLISMAWQHVLFWGGLRGSLSIALVLSLPISLPGRAELIVMIFGAVIFSLLVQGLSISGLIRRIGLITTSTSFKAHEIAQGQLIAEGAALVELDRMSERGMVAGQIYQQLRPEFSASLERLRFEIKKIDDTDPALERSLKDRIRRHLLDVKKARLAMLLREGLLTEESFRELSHQLDQEMAALASEAKH